MRIGFTYDLRDDYLRAGYSAEESAEFDEVETIDALEAALVSLGHTVDRIGGVKNLSSRLSAGDRWDLVFNYAEGMFGFAREAQVPSLLDAFQIPYTLSDGLVFALTLHKGMTKHVVRSLPETLWIEPLLTRRAAETLGPLGSESCPQDRP